MNRKMIVTIIKLIPVVSVILSYILILGPFHSELAKDISGVTVVLGFLGFAFFFIGRRITKEDRLVKILGILDILSTVSIAALYALAIASIAL